MSKHSSLKEFSKKLNNQNLIVILLRSHKKLHKHKLLLFNIQHNMLLKLEKIFLLL